MYLIIVEEPEAVVQRCSVKKNILRNFAKFTGKHLCEGLFFNKVESLRQWRLAQVFSCEFCIISKITCFTGHLWTTQFTDSTYFTDLEMTEYNQKTCGWNSESMKTKNYVRNYARYSTLKKSFLVVYIRTYGCYENYNISILKSWHYKNF